MTVSLVARLKVSSTEAEASLDDLLELLALRKSDGGFCEAWVLVYCARLKPQTKKRIVESLEIPQERLLYVSRSADPDTGSRLLANAIAFLRGHKQVILYDANLVESFGTLVPQQGEVTSPDTDFFGHLYRMNEYHQSYRVGDMLRTSEALSLVLTRSRSSPARTLGQILRPLTRFLRTFNGLLLSPTPCNNRTNAGHYDSLSLVDFSREVSQLIHHREELETSLESIDFVNPVSDFFRFGSSALGALRTVPRGRWAQEIAKVLAWWYAYHLAASREMSNIGHHSSALLHIVRAFESYVLAYFARKGQLRAYGMQRRLRLASGTDAGFENLKQELFMTVPESIGTEFNADLEILRLSRNGNVLIHGYHVPDSVAVRSARTAVKGLVTRVEQSLPAGGILLQGVLGRFSQGERLQGNLGKVVAQALLRSARPSL